MEINKNCCEERIFNRACSLTCGIHQGRSLLRLKVDMISSGTKEVWAAAAWAELPHECVGTAMLLSACNSHRASKWYISLSNYPTCIVLKDFSVAFLLVSFMVPYFPLSAGLFFFSPFSC